MNKNRFIKEEIEGSPNGKWYQRYPSYPPYCGTPQEMDSRSIPPLKPNEHVGESRLSHVTVILRHGARTPWSSDETCWKGYWDEGADTSVWDCELTTFLAPPSPRVVAEEGDPSPQSDAMIWFEKRYDALQYPQGNELHGTCQRGQLLLQGYAQELRNGQHLRHAYLYDSSDATAKHEASMRLLDLNLNNADPPYREPTIRYRSDDDQRTLMSGQVLLRGLFGTDYIEKIVQKGEQPIIPLHVADRDQDVLDANDGECPRLRDLYNQAMQSPEYHALNSTDEFQTLWEFSQNELGNVNDPLDCLMTTICTDRTLPDILDDYGKTRTRHLHNADGENDDNNVASKYGTDLFQRMATFGTEQAVFPYLYNNAEYSKAAMGPLWAEIMDQILPVVDGGDDRGLAQNKMHIISGHDTTLIPLMASLGAWQLQDWPGYASMMILEMHDLIDYKTDPGHYPSKVAFRLLFNGQVLTDHVEGCPPDHDLCDFGVLRKIVTEFGVRNRPCQSEGNSGSVSSAPLSVSNAEALLSTSGGIIMVTSLVMVSALLGALAAVYALERRRRRNYTNVSEGVLNLNANGEGGYHDNVSGEGDDGELI